MRTTLSAGLALLLAACGSESTSPQPLDVSNGATLESLSSHWASNPCIATSIRVAFAADHTGHYKDSWCNSDFTWSSPNATTVLLTYEASCPIGLASIQDISGGAARGTMTGKGYRADGYGPDSCTFTMVGGAIP
jgi:hypothetical protein